MPQNTILATSQHSSSPSWLRSQVPYDNSCCLITAESSPAHCGLTGLWAFLRLITRTQRTQDSDRSGTDCPLNPNQATDSKSRGNMVLKTPTRALPPRKRKWILGSQQCKYSLRVFIHAKLSYRRNLDLCFIILSNHWTKLLLFLPSILHRFTVLPTCSQTCMCKWYTHTHTHTLFIPLPLLFQFPQFPLVFWRQPVLPRVQPVLPQCETQITMTGSPGFPTSVSVQFSSVAQLCPTLSEPMNHSTPGLPVHHQLLEFTPTHEQVFIRSQTSNLTFVSLDIFI